MIDIHSHILPGVDDGPATLEEAIAMLRMAAADGTTDIVATPHASPEFSYDEAVVAAKLAELREACPPGITIHRGCDFHLRAENVYDALEHPSRYSINGATHILVELPDFFHPAAMDSIFREMRAAGLVPIITHPERHPGLMADSHVLQAWVESECLVQITGDSIPGASGRGAKKTAEALLRSGTVHFVASDAHDTRRRPPLLSAAYHEVARRYGTEHAEMLFVRNPRAALTGAAVQRLPETRKDSGASSI